jgi:hypothetical protein
MPFAEALMRVWILIDMGVSWLSVLGKTVIILVFTGAAGIRQHAFLEEPPMRALAIGMTVIAAWFGARIGDDPLIGLVAGAVMATILLLGRRALRRRSQLNSQPNPPKRP